jgi:hypothetical protein
MGRCLFGAFLLLESSISWEFVASYGNISSRTQSFFNHLSIYRAIRKGWFMVMTTPRVHVLRVTTLAEPGAPSRVLEFYALNGLIPESIEMRRISDEELMMEVTLAGLDYCRARLIASKIEALFITRTARLFEGVRKAVAGDYNGVMELTEVCL